MKKRWIVALLVVLVAFFALRPGKRPTSDTAEPATTAANPMPSSTTKPELSSPPAVIPTAVPGTAATTPAIPPSPPAPNAPPPADTPPPLLSVTPEEAREALDNVQFALRDYRTVLGENPIGTNAEITKALTGDNLKQVKIPVPTGSSINGEGEMCDRWGTPYFFHQISGKQMEIHSAGPDGKRGTGDDVVVK